MSKKEFLEKLRVLLEELPTEEREEAIRYYESYFEEAGEDNEQIVLDELGSAERIASQILQDYHGEKNEGIYTEKGYQEGGKETQTPVQYSGSRQEQKENGTSGSGVYVTNKGLSGSTLVIAIIVAVLTFPIWISILATAFGLLMGLFGASVGIVVGFGAGGVGCIIGGAVAFAFGIVKTFTVPIVGAGLIALGLLVFGLGCLMIAAVGGIIRLIIWLVNAIIKLVGRLFHGRKGAAV